MFSKIIAKFKIFLACTIILVFTSGCVRIEENINIDKIGRYEHSFSILVNNYAARMINEDSSFYSKLHDALKDLGFSDISNISTNDEIGSKGISEGNLNSLNISDLNSEILDLTDNSKNYFVYKIYDIIATFKPYNLWDDDNSAISDYKLILNLPVTAISNAQKVSDDKKTHTWNIDPSDDNIIEIKFGILNIVNTLIFFAILTFIVLLSYFLSIFYKKAKYKENELRKCPFCREEILATAEKCKYCKEWVGKNLK